MNDPNRLLDDIRIASPCTASWDKMTGDDTVRFCGECRLNVYNLSSMTAAEAAALVERTEGRLCVRLYKRTDGTVLTRDCPVGLRAAIRRATRAAGAMLTAALGLFSGLTARTAWAGAPDDQNGQCAAAEKPQDRPHVKMGKIALPRGADVSVRVSDEAKALVAEAEVVLTDLETGETIAAEVDEDGVYVLRSVPPGEYTLSATAEGFDGPLPRKIVVKRGQPQTIEISMHSNGLIPLMGEVVAP